VVLIDQLFDQAGCVLRVGLVVIVIDVDVIQLSADAQAAVFVM